MPRQSRLDEYGNRRKIEVATPNQTEAISLCHKILYNDEALHQPCHERGCVIVTPHTGKGYSYPHKDDGAHQVRRILHKTRSVAIENLNEQFKAIFDVHGLVHNGVNISLDENSKVG